jgi:hypothetical protein
MNENIYVHQSKQKIKKLARKKENIFNLFSLTI